MQNNVILHLTPKWSTRIMEDPRREPLCFVSKTVSGWSAVLALPTGGQYPYTLGFPVRLGVMDGYQTDPEDISKGYVMKAWGLTKIGPGTWKVEPSISQAGVLHAYVVLCEVPEPAPWETV